MSASCKIGVTLHQGFSTGVPRNIVIEKKTSFFELVRQNKQIHKINIILYSKEHWQLLLDYYTYNLLITLTYSELQI
jgi:hypothetical protein